MAILLQRPCFLLSFLALLLVLLLPALGSAQSRADPQTERLQLDTVVDRVLRANPGLRTIRQEESAAQALRRQAALRPNPSVSYESQRIPSSNRAYTANVSVPLEIAGQRSARINAAELTTQVVRSDIARSEAELRSATLQAFFDVVTAQDRLELARGSQALAKRSTDVAARRVQAGRAPPPEEARARVAEASAQIELSQAQTELQAAQTRLAALWGGRFPSSAWAEAPAARLPETPTALDLEQRLRNAPILVRARTEIDRRESLVRLAKSQAAPATAVNFGTGTLIETGQRANHIGLTVTIPIFDRNQGNIQEAQIRVSQAQQELVAAEVMLRAELDQALVRLQAARAELQLVEQQIIPDASRTVDAVARGYELGKFSFIEVLDTQRTLIATRGQLLRALGEGYAASAEIERILGPVRASQTAPDVPLIR